MHRFLARGHRKVYSVLEPVMAANTNFVKHLDHEVYPQCKNGDVVTPFAFCAYHIHRPCNLELDGLQLLEGLPTIVIGM